MKAPDELHAAAPAGPELHRRARLRERRASARTVSARANQEVLRNGAALENQLIINSFAALLIFFLPVLSLLVDLLLQTSTNFSSV